MKWLDTELKERNWSRSELARRAGISHVSLSYIYAGKRNPGVEMCQALAKALKLPVATVYEEAGLLPKNKKRDKLTEEALFLFNQLNIDDRENKLAELRALVERRASMDNKGPSGGPQ